MNDGEKPELRLSIEDERKQLFDKAISELAESVGGNGRVLTEEQRRAVADRMLDSRWATAMRDYRSLVGSLSLPPKPDYPHDATVHSANVEVVKEMNAERVQKAWENMRELFKSGKTMNRQTHGEAQMSEETAKELVIFLAKSQGHK